VAASCLAAITALALPAPFRAQDRLDSLLAQYQHEADPIRKARVLAKLGDDQVAQAREQLKSGKDLDSLQTLEKYRDEIRETVTALEAAVPDAEKKPAGFKELQISMRETVRHIDDLILTLPVDKRPFFREVRDDLVKTQNELIDALFPRRPNQSPKKPNP
jgi:predicted  nucleic acid-binding Zn-ribbon protein